MPIYAYQCGQCQGTFDVLQKITDPPKEICEQCGGKLTRLVTAAAFHLKGGGWYKDGYASSKPAEASDASKTDAKPAAKSEGTKESPKKAADKADS